MDGFARILEHGVALDLDLAGLLVDLRIHHVGGEADAGAISVDLVMAGDRAAGVRRVGGEIGER
ncbi:hypothetical protein D3C83_118720 [compost metagenome]